jgi:hypothetical protein
MPPLGISASDGPPMLPSQGHRGGSGGWGVRGGDCSGQQGSLSHAATKRYEKSTSPTVVVPAREIPVSRLDTQVPDLTESLRFW